jgi:hypothetical protein
MIPAASIPVATAHIGEAAREIKGVVAHPASEPTSVAPAIALC